MWLHRNILVITAACALLCGCSTGEQTTSTATPPPPASTAAGNSNTSAASSDELGGEISLKKEGDGLMQAEELISSCTAAQSIHDYVAKTYGSVTPENFGKFFESAEFRNLLKKKTANGASVLIHWVGTSTEKTPTPNSITLTSDSPNYVDLTRYDEKGESTGGSGNELRVLYSKTSPES